MSSPDHHADLVVYDLDGVITTKDTFTALLTKRLRDTPPRLVQALPAAARMMVARHGDTRHRSARRVAEIALTGVGEDEYAAVAGAFGRQIGGDPSWIRVDVVRAICRQHARGTRIVIATATEHQLAQSLLSRAGVPFDLLSASLLQETPSGMTVVDHRVSHRKTAALRELGVALDQADFVTDSITDLPTAQAAGRVVLIGASARTRDRYRRAGVPVIWQRPT